MWPFTDLFRHDGDTEEDKLRWLDEPNVAVILAVRTVNILVDITLLPDVK
jgi:hypothetical protein